MMKDVKTSLRVMRTVLSVPINLVTAADFKQNVARGRDCLGAEKTRKRK